MDTWCLQDEAQNLDVAKIGGMVAALCVLHNILVTVKEINPLGVLLVVSRQNQGLGFRVGDPD